MLLIVITKHINLVVVSSLGHTNIIWKTSYHHHEIENWWLFCGWEHAFFISRCFYYLFFSYLKLSNDRNIKIWKENFKTDTIAKFIWLICSVLRFNKKKTLIVFYQLKFVPHTTCGEFFFSRKNTVFQFLDPLSSCVCQTFWQMNHSYFDILLLIYHDHP